MGAPSRACQCEQNHRSLPLLHSHNHHPLLCLYSPLLLGRGGTSHELFSTLPAAAASAAAMFGSSTVRGEEYQETTESSNLDALSAKLVRLSRRLRRVP
jgi:hypothetical protein